MNAIILFSHGSVLCGAGENLDDVARQMQVRGDAPIVVPGYLNYSDPTFEGAFARVVQQGATLVTVVPYFLVAGYFVKSKLTPKIEAMRARFPHVEVRVAPAMLDHPRLADALLNCAERAQPPAKWREAWERAPQFCRASQACPLYGTPRCPATSESL